MDRTDIRSVVHLPQMAEAAPSNWTAPGLLLCLVVEQKIVNDQTTMTPRQLLSILRLSQALARLRFSNAVRRPTLVLLIAA